MHAVVSKYKNAMYVGFHQLNDMGMVVNGQGLNMNMGEWTVFHQVIDAIQHEVVDSQPDEPIPATYELIDIVYR